MNGGVMQMKELVEKIVHALVDFPEEVDVLEVDGNNLRLLEIRVSKQDMGKLIGKKGKNIDALRTIVSAAGKRMRYMVEVLNDESPREPKICRGKITKLFEDRNYGFIEADDGRSVYYHASSLKEVPLESLSLDQQVEFEIEQAPKGFRAVSIVPLHETTPFNQ
jgi:predicted RNA-binding protein YlqC (UPF0109 family)/cold shock CspA family protein